MKVVFLDIDGVLNNRTSMFLATKGIHPKGRRGIHTMDFGCVIIFKLLLTETDAKFVISSSWRKDSVVASKDVFNAFDWCGFTDAKKYCVGVTPRLLGINEGRGDEIDYWLASHPEVTSYVILDDDSMDIHQTGNFVQTEHEAGLTVKDYIKAKNILLGVDNYT